MKQKHAGDSSSGWNVQRRSRRIAGQTDVVVNPQKLCSVCLGIQPDKRESYNDSYDQRRNPDGLLYRQTVKEIIVSAHAGCLGCIFFCRILFVRIPSLVGLENSDRDSDILDCKVDIILPCVFESRIIIFLLTLNGMSVISQL
jgi:hypothetical protein